ncbi:hypothetical protein M409DRAFT_56559 [Zasmidium cellare ATCC 36951]|uniref:Uncharacterized protein n=1 Tax=Zasmidium cellare ATCC 36951 TaxID=1080233 RepID=A0A6A6CEC2_ZASCE|nr:uncharacterized protein M409DRAFT_56559 [Zasmidium cellare ATCC 36951]KAF2164272.1 hypothetical protein M409DRAFT_56559 [Zasmidium cellare ATCC 36951]
MASANAALSDIHEVRISRKASLTSKLMRTQRFHILRDEIEKAMGNMFNRYPHHLVQLQSELVQLCEQLLSSWLGPSTGQDEVETAAWSSSDAALGTAPYRERDLPSCFQDRPRSTNTGRLSMSQIDEVHARNTRASTIDNSQDTRRILIPTPVMTEHMPLSTSLDAISGFAADDHLNDSLSSGQLSRLPSYTISPVVIREQIKTMVLPHQISCWSLLLRLFYATGSPEAFLQLRDACHFTRRMPGSTAPQPSDDVAATVKALDDLDSTSFITSVLRRYHLVRLVEHRNRLFENHQSQHNAETVRQFKYGHSKVKQLRPREGQKKAASATLRDLMVGAYPHLHDASNQPLHNLSGQYDKSYATLKRRLGYGKSWHTLAQKFSIGILCLVPVAGEFSIYNHQIEKMPNEAFQTLLSLLLDHRGSFLLMSSQMLSLHIFDILLRRDLRQWYPLENFSDQITFNEGYDSFGLVIGCTNKAAEHPRGNEGDGEALHVE